MLGLWLLLGCLPVHAQPAEAAPELLEPPQETSFLNARPDSELRIQWRASVRQEGGQFLLYRGTSPESLQIFAARVPRGRSWYEVVDSPASSGLMLYELRFRDREGREHVLTTQTVSVSIIGSLPSPAVRSEGSAQSVAALDLLALPVPRTRRLELAGRSPAVLRLDDEPPTPPPERS